MKHQTDTYAGDTYLQIRSFEDYLIMRQKGRNVSILSASDIFYNHKELEEECAAEAGIMDSFYQDSYGNR